jgi:hypothetical protein
MRKQCNQCGDYFYTSEKKRLFCGRRCAAINCQTPGVPKNVPTKYTKPKPILVDYCYLCQSMINESALITVLWQGHYHEVCCACLLVLEDKVEETGGDISDYLPSPM